ncbi:bifunctional nicotinamide-nucleotide adenylyltransferase/Nudix hydroxylase [Azospirillum picis]|uniref:Bifunctional NMN adenylyltransferase/nudix hydrolase n=1 Tax=Azospirillum picis TaxID=488438 RepID=A0ABU0MJM0_9PROT|nr:bifunctional nicotinamide-nucleotide adenylyltransferase/Nudix hydroxylase [Azospirillum picis]MBP2299866.1 bifunctional NMN adenylyltransferase/nudix hydrolase [Azospirillum picis]MDQ0533662.1 bifunctional NMN adenylyltransferase/nudix hydrolase [Azospirillum picis]
MTSSTDTGHGSGTLSLAKRTAASGAHGAPTCDFMVFVGRFRPFHLGHLTVMQRALSLGKHLIVLVGSSRQARSHRNPFRFEEVRACILGAFPPEECGRITVLPLIDRYNDLEWIRDVQAAVHGVVVQHHRPADGSAPVVRLIGHSKDHSSYYLRMFPQWGAVECGNCQGISATPIRDAYFADADAALVEWREALPANVAAFMAEFARTDEYRRLAEESGYIAKYRAGWAKAPYPPTFLTADAVVVLSGHVLLVERRGLPGRGLLALPGGFVGQHERIKDAMIRELREETKLKVPAGFLEGSIRASQIFDHPYRSSRGRTVTQAFLIQLKATEEGFPKVRGGDDAKSARWMPIAEIDPEHMFEDHFHIIQTMIAQSNN